MKIAFTRAYAQSEDNLAVIAVRDDAEIYDPDGRAYLYRWRCHVKFVMLRKAGPIAGLPRSICRKIFNANQVHMARPHAHTTLSAPHLKGNPALGQDVIPSKNCWRPCKKFKNVDSEQGLIGYHGHRSPSQFRRKRMDNIPAVAYAFASLAINLGRYTRTERPDIARGLQ